MINNVRETTKNERYMCYWYDFWYCCYGLSPAFIDSDDLWYPERYACGRCPCANNPGAADCLYAGKIGVYERLKG